MAEILIGTATTDADGIAQFLNLPAGSFKYVRKAAPLGYIEDVTPVDLTIAAGETKNETQTAAPIETGKLIAHKHVSGDIATPVAGATFTLMKGGKTMLAESAATAADGTVSFDNLMTITDNKQEYTIKEVEVPVGYLPNMNPYELPIDVGTTGNTQDVPNVATGDATLNVTLDDVNYPIFGLEGSEYDVYYVEP